MTAPEETPATKPEGLQKDFNGDIKVDDTIPTKAELGKACETAVYDKGGKKHTFKDLVASQSGSEQRRVLAVFIRHFFCGNCQEYLRFLSQSISASALASLSPPTSIIVIGCGTASLIPDYITYTSTPFPVYADPSRKLYDILRMTSTMSLGPKAPEYMRSGILKGAIKSIWQELRAGRRMFDGGDWAQVGGEFLFENGKVGWCHRMRNTRDHAELGELRKVLGLDGVSQVRQRSPRKRWSMAAIGGTSGKGGESGLGRRLSKRMSWHGGKKATTQKNGDGAMSRPEKKMMDKLREEGDADTAKAAGTEDAFAKLTNGTAANGAPKAPAINGSAHTNGSVNGHPPDAPPQDLVNGVPAVSKSAKPADSSTNEASSPENATVFAPEYESSPPVTPASGEVMTGILVHRKSSVLPADVVQDDETPTKMLNGTEDAKMDGCAASG